MMTTTQLSTTCCSAAMRLSVRSMAVSSLLFLCLMAPVAGAETSPRAGRGASGSATDLAPRSRAKARNLQHRPPTTTIYWFIRSSWRAKTDTLVTQIEEQLKNNPRIRFTDSQTILEPSKGAEQDCSKAQRLIAEIKKALFELDLDKAAQLSAQAVRFCEASLAWLIDSPFGTGKLVDALAYQALSAFRNGDSEILRTALSKILAINPRWTLPKSFPSEMKDNLMSLRLEQDELGKAAIQVATHPNAGVVFLDGTRVGRAPLLTDPVSAGLHYLTIRRRGFRNATRIVQVTPPRDTSVEINLDPVDTTLLHHLKKALAEMGAAVAGPGIRGTAKRLGVSVLVLGRIVVRGQEATVTLVAYDIAKGTITGPAVTKTVNWRTPGRSAAQISEALVEQIAPKPKPTKTPHPKAKKRAESSRLLLTWRRFRKWPGFWYTVGGTAGLILTGAAVGLALGLTSRPRTYPGAARHILFLRSGRARHLRGLPTPAPGIWRFP